MMSLFFQIIRLVFYSLLKTVTWPILYKSIFWDYTGWLSFCNYNIYPYFMTFLSNNLKLNAVFIFLVVGSCDWLDCFHIVRSIYLICIISEIYGKCTNVDIPRTSSLWITKSSCMGLLYCMGYLFMSSL